MNSQSWLIMFSCRFICKLPLFRNHLPCLPYRKFISVHWGTFTLTSGVLQDVLHCPISMRVQVVSARLFSFSMLPMCTIEHELGEPLELNKSVNYIFTVHFPAHDQGCNLVACCEVKFKFTAETHFIIRLVKVVVRDICPRQNINNNV